MPETNLPTKATEELGLAGQRLLEAATAYWLAHRRATGGADVVWLSDTNERLVVIARGEYRATLIENFRHLASSPCTTTPTTTPTTTAAAPETPSTSGQLIDG